MIWGRRDHLNVKKLTLNYCDFCILVFVVFSLNDMASKCTRGINFSVFILVTRVAQGKKHRQQAKVSTITHDDYSIFAVREHTLPLKLVSMCEDGFARISLVLSEFRQSKATSARNHVDYHELVKSHLWRLFEKMNYRS